jgi:glycosyltransferase involved in cell wall biosynthesis
MWAKRIDGAICVSEKMSKYADHYLGISYYSIIPNGSDPALFSPKKERRDLFVGYEDAFKVIYIGDSGYPWQGFDYVKNVAQRARRRRDNIVFIALDSSPLASADSQDNLLILPRVNYFDVPAYVASADACLCLYHDLSWTQYGFTGSSLKLFDYMACARPIIASKLGQIGEVVEDGVDGLLTNNDLGDVYDKILLCMENKYEAEEMGRRAREKVLRFYNWERAAKSTLDVLGTVMTRYSGKVASQVSGTVFSNI